MCERVLMHTTLTGYALRHPEGPRRVENPRLPPVGHQEAVVMRPLSEAVVLETWPPLAVLPQQAGDHVERLLGGGASLQS